jgi:serine/threonine protein kinase
MLQCHTMALHVGYTCSCSGAGTTTNNDRISYSTVNAPHARMFMEKATPKLIKILHMNRYYLLLQAVENEIMMIRQLKHPNVVTYLGVEICNDQHANNHLNIFLEYVDGGSLRKLLQDCGPMTEEHTAYNTTQVLRKIKFCNTYKTLHDVMFLSYKQLHPTHTHESLWVVLEYINLDCILYVV